MKARATKSVKRPLKTIPTPVELQTTLRDAGLRSTAPRIAVLEYLHKAATPASHAELHDRLAVSGFDRATLYRNLIDLADAGLVTRTDLGDHVWRFELRRDGALGKGKGTGKGSHAGDHPHFVCTDCGSLSCLPGTSIRISPAKGAPRALERRAVNIQLSGLCDACG